MSVSPNVFQRTIRLWETIHPYNAVQVMRLREPLEEEKIRAAWDAIRLADLPASGELSLRESTQGGADLVANIEAMLNTEMRETDAELRPFHLADDTGGHYVGCLYRHIVADSFSIRELMRRWLVHRYGGETPPRLSQADGGYWRHLGPAVARWSPLRAAGDIPRWTAAMKCCRRVESDDFADGTMRFDYATLPPGTLSRIRATAKRHGATVNDVFLSAIAGVCRHLDVNSPRLARVETPTRGLGGGGARPGPPPS